MADKASNFNTGAAIVSLWQSEIENGLVDLELPDDITTGKFRDDQIAFVDRVLQGDPSHGIPARVFTKNDEKHTKQVAKDLGKICRLLTTQKSTVDKDTFKAAYRLVKVFHEA